MRALRRTSVIISAICITVTTIIWLGTEFQGLLHGADFWPSTLFVAAIDFFFIGILWVPHRLKDSKYANISVWVAFGLSLAPLIVFFYILYRMSQIQC